MKVNCDGKKSCKQKNYCIICMTRIVNCKTIECSHQFCYRCLSKWGRRKGNCPICRQNIRKIQHKNKIIEPQYLKIFDQENCSEELNPVFNPQRVIFQPLMLFNWNPYLLNTMNQIPTVQGSQGYHTFPILYNLF